MFKRYVPSPSLAVAMLALFVALTGSAYAGVKLSKNSVTTKSIKNGAVTGKKIKKKTITASNIKSNTITGTQINESKLVGLNAATLAGKGADAFAPSGSWVHFNVPMNRGDAPKTLATIGPFTFTGKCDANGATNFDYDLSVTSTSSSSYYSTNELTAGVPYSITSDTNVAPNAKSYSTSEPRFLDLASGIATLDGDGESFGLYYGYPDHACRYVGSIWFP